MVIYIEQILIDNFIINYFIILTLSFIFKVKLKKINIILSSALGSVVALITPILNFNLLFSVLSKLLLSLSMVAILKRYNKFKEFILYYLSFLIITFMFGGACLFILTMFDNNFSASNYYSYSLPLGVIVIITFFLTVTLKNIFSNLYARKKVSSFVYKIKVYNNNEFDELTAYLDSGNFLKDNLTNKPITIIDYNSLKNLFKNVSLTDILLNKTQNLSTEFKNPHLMNVSSVSMTSKLLVLEVDKLEIYLENKVNIIEQACIGLSIKTFINDLGYNALLNPQLI